MLSKKPMKSTSDPIQLCKSVLKLKICGCDRQDCSINYLKKKSKRTRISHNSTSRIKQKKIKVVHAYASIPPRECKTALHSASVESYTPIVHQLRPDVNKGCISSNMLYLTLDQLNTHSKTHPSMSVTKYNYIQLKCNCKYECEQNDMVTDDKRKRTLLECDKIASLDYQQPNNTNTVTIVDTQNIQHKQPKWPNLNLCILHTIQFIAFIVILFLLFRLTKSAYAKI